MSRMETIHRLHNRHFIHLFISKPQMVTMDAVTNVGVVSILEDTSVRYLFIFNILVSGFFSSLSIRSGYWDQVHFKNFHTTIRARPLAPMARDYTTWH